MTLNKDLNFNDIVNRIKKCQMDVFMLDEQYDKEMGEINKILHYDYECGLFAESIINTVQDIISGSYRDYTDFDLLEFDEFAWKYILENMSEETQILWDDIMRFLDIDSRLRFIVSHYVDGEEGRFAVGKGHYIIVCSE